MIFKNLFTNYLYKYYELCKKGFVIFKERGFIIFLARLLNFLWRKIYSKKTNVGLRFNLKDIFSEAQVDHQQWKSAHRDQFNDKKKFLLNKTIILSSHRLSTVKNSDNIIFLDKI